MNTGVHISIAASYMYFSGEKSDDITFDDPDNRCIRVTPTLYAKVQNNNEQNTRVFLDTHLLRIRNQGGVQKPSSERLVTKSDVSVLLGTMPLMPALVYITNSLMTAEFKEMSSDVFKESYLAPLDIAIKESNISDDFLSQRYVYPFGDVMHMEHDIQGYFNLRICSSLKDIYCDICGTNSYFGNPSITRPPLDRRQIIKPEIIHMAASYLDPDMRYPEICFAIGGYKKGTYNLPQGFEDLKEIMEDYKSNLSKRGQLRQLRSYKPRALFPDKGWSPKVLFALLLRKYLYQAFLCGTDRFFISDHQTFSGFFKYEIVDGSQMVIDYYIINDPETVAHGITLRSAIAGFFYKNNADALDTKDRLATHFVVASKTEGLDPFANVLPISTSGSSGESSGVEYPGNLDTIRENADNVAFDAIRGNTYCRIIYDAAKCYPSLGSKLPSTVFAKLYHYSNRLWEENDLAWVTIPHRKDYYGMFINELEINAKIARSRFALNFPKLLVSGYWNGLPDHPMHIFENLGKQLPEEQWDRVKVHKVIKSRLREIHMLGISHNDIRPANIHVSVSGKVSLIDFGLSDYASDDVSQKNDFKALDHIFGMHGNDNDDKKYNQDQSNQKSDNEIPDKAGTDGNHGSDNSTDEVVFDEMSLDSDDTRTTKDDPTSKVSHRK